MKKKWLKIITPILVILLIVMVVLTGKNLLNKGESGKSIDIPKDGIISASVFKELNNSNDMIMFNGESGELKYQWLFLSGDIQEPKDINLLINFENKLNNDEKKILSSNLIQKFSFEEKDGFESTPNLTIELSSNWKCNKAEIYKITNNKAELVNEAAVESGDKTSISFNVKDNKGYFYIVGKEIKEEVKAEKKDNTNVKADEGEKYLTDSSSGGKKDKYLTDPTPAGKPKPTEWQDVKVDKSKVKYCTLSIRCDTLLVPKNYEVAKSNGKADMIPSNGVIYATKTVEFYEGEFVFDVLLREVQKYGIHMEYTMTPIYNSNYIEGINNLYEFDGGELSGWMYKVNGWFPNYGCSRYLLKDGDVIEWVYTCDLGKDVGCEWLEDTR